MKPDVHKLIIIGSGPAGYTAAIYAARANLAPVLFEGVQLGGAAGGQLMLTSDVENFPGFPTGIQGPELMEKIRAQAVRFETTMLQRDITAVDFSHRPFTLTSDDKTWQTESVIISTGASAKWLGLESETKLRGHGVSACATCDGAFFKEKKVVVVGGGDTALEEALYLTRFAREVVIVHRREELRASAIMQQRAKQHPKISFIFNVEITEIKDIAQNKVTGVVLKNTVDNAQTDVACDGVFIAIGHRPNTDIFKNQITLDDHGYIKIHDGSKTNIEGVFAAGDVHDPSYRQAVTAAGYGCIAALDAQRFLTDLESAH